jgi:hypothetical protein
MYLQIVEVNDFALQKNKEEYLWEPLNNAWPETTVPMHNNMYS